MQKMDFTLRKIMQVTDSSNLSKLAEVLGENKQTVNAWAHKGVPAKRAVEFAQKYGLNLHELVFGQPFVDINDEMPVNIGHSVDQVAEQQAPYGVDYAQPNLGLLPLLAVNQAGVMSPGKPVLAIDREALARQQVAVTSAAVAVVVDLAMAPAFELQDFVLVDQSDRRIIDGATYLIQQDGRLLVRYLQQVSANKIRIYAENATVVPAIEVDGEAFTQVGRVRGRVGFNR